MPEKVNPPLYSRIGFIRNAPDSEYEKYPQKIKNIFASKYFRHIKKIILWGGYLDSSRVKEKAWARVTAYNGKDEEIFSVTPPGNFDFREALKCFSDQADKEHQYLRCIRDRLYTYENEANVAEFFKHFENLREFKVCYREQSNGYVVHAINDGGRSDALFPTGVDKDGKPRSFSNAEVAIQSLPKLWQRTQTVTIS